MKLEVEPTSENDLWIFLLLSTRSDDLDRADQIRLIQQLSPAGSTILFSRKHSAKAKGDANIFIRFEIYFQSIRQHSRVAMFSTINSLF